MARKTPLQRLVETSALQGNPLNALTRFVTEQTAYEETRQIDKLRFVGYVLSLGYDYATIITSDPYKLAVGGIPRGSFLIMTPENAESTPPHFTLLRVRGVSTTPLTTAVQQTYFELHKKSMPELDIWTQSELQWGALECDVLGMFYPNVSNASVVSFSGDVNNVASAHRYRVYAPDSDLLDLVVNGIVKTPGRITLGSLRATECQLGLDGSGSEVSAYISMYDFRGCRTAMFGKTRLGKSNVIKLIAQGMLETTSESHDVGQLIFDINGEYANDNPQDGNVSIRSAYEKRCTVYALTKRPTTESRQLRLNFYEQPDRGLAVLASLLAQHKRDSIYIKAFTSVNLPSLEQIENADPGDKVRLIRRLQFYWGILKKAGFSADEKRLKGLRLSANYTRDFTPHFKKELRDAAYRRIKDVDAPDHPKSLDALVAELEVVGAFQREEPNHASLTSSSGKPLFEAEDKALLNFIASATGAGPTVLRPYHTLHSPHAGEFISEILELLDAGHTVILDLGSATDEIRRFFSDMLSQEVFNHQERKFVTNQLGTHFVQLYFEEAHNLFPINDKDLTDVYARFAKEGAKFHIGMLYSTQSPSTISKELLAQTENFFVAHLSSQLEAKALSQLQVAFSGVEEDILRAKTPGYIRMLTMSHRFVVPVQARRFAAKAESREHGNTAGRT